MQSTLRQPFAAALLLSATALLAQPAAARDRHYVEAPAATPAIVHVRDGDGERWDRDHDRWDRDYGRSGRRDDWRRDNQPPAIDDLTPEPGQLMGGRRATLVSASFVDALSGIDLGSVRLRLNGRDVTAQAQIDPAHIRLVQDLWPGHHVAEIVVRDRAGNVGRRAWQFDVAGGQDGHDGGYGRPYGWRR